MAGQSADEDAAAKALVNDIIEEQHTLHNIVLQQEVSHAEIVVAVKGVDALQDAVGGAHTAVGLLGNDVECLVGSSDVLVSSDILEVAHDIRDLHAVEVEYLAATEDSLHYLLLLGGGKDKDDV